MQKDGNSNLPNWRFASVLLVLSLLASLPAHAQSCALCYTQAASSGHRMIHALQSGILILIIPPMFLSIGFTLLAYRKRNQFRQATYPSRPKAATPERNSKPSVVKKKLASPRQ